MQIEVIRTEFTEKSTIGRLFINGNYFCYTLEDKVRDGDKVYGKTAIPDGVYDVRLSFSNRFNVSMPEILNVRGFSGVRIHSGNTDADTLGCILLGYTKSRDFIGNSRSAFKDFMQATKGCYPLRLVIKNENKNEEEKPNIESTL